VSEVLAALSDVFTADVVCMAHPKGDQMVLTAACGLPEDSPAFTTGWPLGEAPSETGRTGRSVARLGLGPSDDLPAVMADLGVRSAAWVPLPTGGPNQALIALFRVSSEPFTASDLKILDSVAYRLSLSIDAGERRLTIERLANVGHRLARHLDTDALLAEAAELFRTLARADAGVAVTVDGDRNEVHGSSGIGRSALAAWPAAVGDLPGWATVAQGRPHLVDDIRAGSTVAPFPPQLAARAYLCVPIAREGRTMALLCAFHGVPASFTSDSAKVAKIFATYVGAAMVNAELYRALAHSESRLRLITDSISDMIALVDRSGVFRYASPSYAREVGRDPEELIGLSALDLAHPDDRDALRTGLREVDRSPKVEYRLLAGDGHAIWVESALRPGPPPGGEIVLSSRVITDRKELEDELRRRATHDPMTGLANGDLVRQRLDQALRSHEAGDVGLLFCDLDNFKSVNDNLGHEAGDVLICQVAERLLQCTRPVDMLSRLGGDEFLIVLDGVDSLRAVERIGERVLSALEPPFDVGSGTMSVTASVGGVIGPRGGATAVSLLRDADAAMYQAKANGRVRVAIFDDTVPRAQDRGLRP